MTKRILNMQVMLKLLRHTEHQESITSFSQKGISPGNSELMKDCLFNYHSLAPYAYYQSMQMASRQEGNLLDKSFKRLLAKRPKLNFTQNSFKPRKLLSSASVYFKLLTWTIEGDIDVSRYIAAWFRLYQTNPDRLGLARRTNAKASYEPLEVPLMRHDWSGCSEADCERLQRSRL